MRGRIIISTLSHGFPRNFAPYSSSRRNVYEPNETGRFQMQIGYARSSTLDQEAGYQAQIKALTAAGCDKVFAEKISSVAEPQQLDAALDYARQGDALVVTKLDRMAHTAGCHSRQKMRHLA